MNNNETSKSFQAHITYDDAIRAIDLENTIYAIRLFAQDQMRVDANDRIQAYTDCVKISGVEKGSIILNFDLNTAINIAQLAVGIYSCILTYKSNKKTPSNDQEPWISTAIRDLNTAINNGIRIYLCDEHGNIVEINSGKHTRRDNNTSSFVE